MTSDPSWLGCLWKISGPGRPDNKSKDKLRLEFDTGAVLYVPPAILPDDMEFPLTQDGSLKSQPE
jgi:hypothetical protein